MHSAIASRSSLGNSIDQCFTHEQFVLESSVVLPNLSIAYLTLGELNFAGDNVILLTHGYSSSHRLGKGRSAEASEGGWNLLVGPGKPIDPEKYFIVSSNMLGSSYGSTGPSSINPETGLPYGRHFPEISFVDIVNAQRLLLDHLGVRRLKAIVGASYGGLQAFQWAQTYPDRVDGVVAVVSSLWAPDDGKTEQYLVDRFSQDPDWNDGDFYQTGPITETLTRIRIEMLRDYGAEAGLLAKGVKPENLHSELLQLARPWAEKFDPHSLIVLVRAATRLRLAEHVDRITAKVLFLLSSSDRLFPPSLETPVMDLLRSAGIDARYRLLESDRGHRASHEDAGLWADDLREFLLSLD